MSWLDASLELHGAATRQSRPLREFLSASDAERAAESAIAWIKAIRHLPVDGTPFRDRFTYRDESLWWFAELFLHKEDQVARWFAVSAALGRAFEETAPAAVSVASGDPALLFLCAEAARRARVAWRGPSARAHGPGDRLRLMARSHFLTSSAYWSRQRSGGSNGTPPLGALPRGAVAAFVHGAFWRGPAAPGGGEEGYLGPVLDALRGEVGEGRVALVGIGPRTNFRARRWWDAVTEEPDAPLPFVPIERLVPRGALRGSLDVWRARSEHASAMRASPALRDHAVIDGLDLWPLVGVQLDGIAWLQFPWSARAMDEAGAAMERLEPSAILTYAEAGGWGRALMLEARRRRIPSAGMQHGFIYRHWLNYRHAPDEMSPSPSRPGEAGFPRPDVTLLFDAYARRHLEQAGAFPPGTLAVTGSPRLDAMAASLRALTDDDRARVRASVGAAPHEPLVVVATKHSQMGRVFRELVAAARRLPGVRLVVKCHPAETPEPYERDAAGAPHVTVAPASADLPALVASARAVVTVNSTVALDAMLFGVPALVVHLPNNLSPFVDAGVMVGADGQDEIAESLRRLIADDGTRAALAARQQAFLREHDVRADGGAASRAARAVAHLARR